MTARNWHQEISDLVLTNEDEAVAHSLLLAQSFGDSSDAQVRLDVANALYAGAKSLGTRGRSDAAVRIAEEISSRFADDPVFRVQAVVGAALSLVAELQVLDGQPTEAIATHDEALSRAGRVEELTRRGAGVALLLAKSRILANLDRREEAIVVLDSALQAIQEATEGKGALRTRQAAMAIVAKLDNVAALDRYADAQDLGRQLSDVLAHVPGGPPLAVATASAVPEPSESSLAAALAELINDDECWAVFEGRTPISPTEAAERACRLYGVSEPWALPRESTGPVTSASATVRHVADGYALLTAQWSPAERSSLPLPRRAVMEHHQLLRRQGVAGWAAALGHPLHLREAESDVRSAGTSPGSQAGAEADVSPDVVRGMVKCLYLYEFIGILSSSRLGLEALKYKQLRAISISYLRAAVDWARSCDTDDASDGRVGVAAACWSISQGFFCVSHGETLPPSPLSPAEAPLRELLHETGGYAWLVEKGVSLPAWTRATDW